MLCETEVFERLYYIRSSDLGLGQEFSLVDDHILILKMHDSIRNCLETGLDLSRKF
jgi:hypothetical protein